ncbi:MAG: hypothetical protein M1818_006830 [Claussenomyces sp. TS43310]|nr:MAG: hypothetical protein M1818_006830 [Claussenomyces sp. TS43310]
MAHDFKDLIERVVDEIVLSGDHGIAVAELLRLADSLSKGPVANQGAEKPLESDEARPLSGVELPRHHASGHSEDLVDRSLSKVEVLRLLLDHPKIVMGDNGADDNLSSDEIETLPPSTRVRSRFAECTSIPLDPRTPSTAASYPVLDVIVGSKEASANLTDTRQQPQSSLGYSLRAFERPNPAAIRGSEGTPVSIPRDSVRSQWTSINSASYSTQSKINGSGLGAGDAQPSRDGEASTPTKSQSPLISGLTVAVPTSKISFPPGRDASSRMGQATTGAAKRNGSYSPTLAPQPPAKRRGRPPGKAKSRVLSLDTAPYPSEPLAKTESDKLPSESLDPPKRRGRPRKQKFHEVTFISYDESQRQDGVPGVYFDIPDFQNSQPEIGSERNTCLACFKSDRLKSLPWMNGTAELGTRIENLNSVGRPPGQAGNGSTVGVDLPQKERSAERARTTSSKHILGPNEISTGGRETHQNVSDDWKAESFEFPTTSVTTGSAEPFIAHRASTSIETQIQQAQPSLLSVVRGFGLPASSYQSPYAEKDVSTYRSPYAPKSVLAATPFQTTSASTLKAFSQDNPYQQRAAVPSNKHYRSPYSANSSPPASKAYRSPYSSKNVQPLVSPTPHVLNITHNAGNISLISTGSANKEHEPVKSDKGDKEPDSEITATEKYPADDKNADGPDAEKLEKDWEREQKLAAERTLETTLEIAQNVDLPGIKYRLAVTRGALAGNVYLSANKQSVVFLEAKEDSTFPMIFPVSEIIGHPKTSKFGSTPMELTITTRGQSGANVSHSFKFSYSKVAFEAANALRAQIVTAIMISENVEDSVDDVPGRANDQKPFKCEKCGGSWKNFEGLRYHTTKAQVQCNPSFKDGAFRRPRGRRPASKAKAGEGEDYSINSDDQEQERHAVWKNTDGGPLYERYLSNGDTHETSRTGVSTLAPVNKSVSTLSSSSMLRQRESRQGSRNARHPESGSPRNLILSLLDDNNGVFSGDRGLWYATILASIKRGRDAGVQSHGTVNAALASLMDSGVVQKIAFSFKGLEGRMISRSVITHRGIDPLSSEVMALKERIKAAAPGHHIPMGFAPSDKAQKFLDALESQLHNVTDMRTALNTDEIERVMQLLEGQNGVAQSESPSLRRSSRRIARPTTYAVTDIEPRALGRSIRRGTSSPSPAVFLSLSRSVSPDEEDDCALTSTKWIMDQQSHLQTWQSASAYLQAPDGIWNQVLPFPTKRRKYNRVRLPDPVTFMQTWDNPAWGFRPLGHGLQPRSGRSSKRLEESARLGPERSFQPVGTAVKRPFGPTAQLKRLLETSDRKRKNSATLTDHHSEPLPKRPRRRTKKNSQMSQSLEGASEAVVNRTLLDFRPLIQDRNDSVLNPGLESLPSQVRFSSVFTRSGEHVPKTAYSAIKWMAPNTDLGEAAGLPQTFFPDMPKMADFSGNVLHADHQPHFYQSTDDSQPYAVRFVGIQILKSRNELWNKMDQVFFEADCSWTLQGWFPSARYILEQSLPRNIQELVSRKTGPPISPESYPSPQWAKFLSEVETVASWEQNEAALLGIGTVIPGYTFINHTMTTLQCPRETESHTTNFLWSDLNSFTLETLPYEAIGDDSDFLDVARPPSAQLSKTKRSYNKRRDVGDGMRRPAARNLRRADISQSSYAPETRDVAHRPGDKQETPNERVDQLRAANAAHNLVANEGGRQALDEPLSSVCKTRLMVTVTVIRTLTGGLEKKIDWILVTKLFPKFSTTYTKQLWVALLQSHSATIDKLSVNFQNFFLKAYARGEIAPIDYDQLLHYDWEALVNLAMPLLDIKPTNGAPHLPGSKSEMTQTYDVVEVRKKSWREDFFDFRTPVHKRVITSTSEQATTPLLGDSQPKKSITDLEKAKSWVRACTLTPESAYDQSQAARALSQFPRRLVETGLTELLSSKVLVQRNKGRPTPGRGFNVGEPFHNSLRKHLSEQHFVDAERLKRRMDEEFGQGRTIEVEWMAEDGEVLAITNLQAAGRVRLEPRDVPAHKFGLKTLAGTYQSRRMDKGTLRFSMSIRPTDSYIYDADLGVLRNIFSGEHNPPLLTDGALPVWADVNGRLMRGVWRVVIAAVLGVMAMRPGMSIEDVARVMSPALEEWEVRVLIQWLVQVEALISLVDGIEGWNVGEWWWLVAGRA